MLSLSLIATDNILYFLLFTMCAFVHGMQFYRVQVNSSVIFIQLNVHFEKVHNHFVCTFCMYNWNARQSKTLNLRPFLLIFVMQVHITATSQTEWILEMRRTCHFYLQILLWTSGLCTRNETFNFCIEKCRAHCTRSHTPHLDAFIKHFWPANLFSAKIKSTICIRLPDLLCRWCKWHGSEHTIL